jgi:Viral BACON domain
VLQHRRDKAAYKKKLDASRIGPRWVWFFLFTTVPFILVSCTGITARNNSNGGPVGPSTPSSSVELVVSPSNLSFSALHNGSNPGAQTLSISNSGSGTLAWTASGDQPWIMLSSSSGSGPQTVLVGATTGSLAAGNYSGTVTISAVGATPPVQIVKVTLAITSSQTPSPTPTPALAVLPTTVTFSGTAGGSNPGPQSVNISNGGGGTLSWTAVASQPWVMLSAASGTGPQALSVEANTSGLSAGNYSASVTISAPSANPATQIVNVSLTLAAATPTPAPPPTPTGNGAQHYVAPNGSSSGDGSIGRPWDLQTALNQPAAVQPGDTIWLRNGTYGNGVTQFASALTGTTSQPIVVRQYPGERATIAGELTVNGSDAWYWGFEVANTTAPSRSSGTSGSFAGPTTYTFGIVVFGSNTKFINLVVHDTQEGFSAWTPAQNCEIYGSLSYNNGWQGTDRGHGHGIYTQNQNGIKTISDNILFQGFGEGIQAYGSDAAFVQNFVFDGNTIFNSGSLAVGGNDDNIIVEGGGGGPQNITLTNNYTYHTLNVGMGASFLSGSNLTVTGNYWVGGNTTLYASSWSGGTFTNNTIYSLTGYGLIASTLHPSTWDNNSYYDGAGLFGELNSQSIPFASWQSATGLDKNSSYTTGPKGASVFVRPNKYEAGRANITIYNWDLTSTVSVDVSKVLTVGSSYELRNAQDYFGVPVLSGIYSGATLTIPMTGLTVAQPTGTVPRAPLPTGPQFGAFVLITK